MCGGYDMRNIESVCSGHGLCTADGRCDCMQGWTGDLCSLSCELDQGPLTCSGHGTCDERIVVHRSDIVEYLNQTMSQCSSPEKIYLTRDKVVAVDTKLYYMTKELGYLQTYIFDTVAETFEKRHVVIDDYYIRGVAYRKPYGFQSGSSTGVDGAVLRVPFMPCEDTISILRETYKSNLFPVSKSDVSIDCDLKYGADASGYTIHCGNVYM